MENPFNITKAVDYTDNDIIKYWVDLSDGGFETLLKPTQLMPMLVLGSKGSGKTHLMRYFSFQLQKIRHKDNVFEGVIKDGYIGIYLRCSGLNSDRFRGKGQEDEVWNAVFAYNLELWIGQLLLDIALDFNLNQDLQKSICNDIINLFEKDKGFRTDNFLELKSHIRSLQNQVDFAVNNSAISRSLNGLEILLSSGKFILGIPKIFQKYIEQFEKTVFVYLIDELENINANQQKLINTLYREKELPVTFRIGARLYGIRTYETLGANEENREGSEFEKFELDSFFRNNETQYEKFIRQVCYTRLIKNDLQIESPEQIDEFFEPFDLNKYMEKLSKKKYAIVHVDRLMKKLKSTKKYSNEAITEIINNLSCSKNLMIEKVNHYLFYKDWNEKVDLKKASSSIQKECVEYLENKTKESRHGKTLAYYKSDLRDQLTRESREKIPYVEFKKFIKMSSGIPRNLLNILKHSYRWSYFNESKKPFVDGVISIDSQIKGVYEACDWFFEDNRMATGQGKLASTSMFRIGRVLREMRYSDLPPECSISSFAVSYEKISQPAADILKMLVEYSYLIITDSRRDKNTNEQHMTYKINGIIAPKWELSINKRGIVGFNEKELAAIFEVENEDDFIAVFSPRITKYNAPFGISDSPTLF